MDSLKGCIHQRDTTDDGVSPRLQETHPESMDAIMEEIPRFGTKTWKHKGLHNPVYKAYANHPGKRKHHI